MPGDITSVQISGEDVLRLQGIARDLGYRQSRGPGKRSGMGNISAMLRAIAAGDVLLERAQNSSSPDVPVGSVPANSDHGTTKGV